MKKKSSSKPVPPAHKPTDDEVRDYAYHPYEQSGRIPGRDIDNWLEAKACLEANIPKPRSHVRLHHHRNGNDDDFAAAVVIAAGLEANVDPQAVGSGSDIKVERVLLLSS